MAVEVTDGSIRLAAKAGQIFAWQIARLRAVAGHGSSAAVARFRLRT